nr:MAG TPA: hypothetical protein [Caudoviricetes sp.]DAT69825.1 MAG TPA: hypothetical protein [Caudoviricetes sp.]
MAIFRVFLSFRRCMNVSKLSSLVDYFYILAKKHR